MNEQPLRRPEEADLFATRAAEENSSEKIKGYLKEQHIPSLTLGVEAMTAILIVAVLLLIGVFYLGFLRGKAVERSDLSSKIRAFRNHQTASPIMEEEPVAMPAAPATAPPVATPTSAAIPVKTVEKPPQKPYTVQVAAYRTEGRALTELSQLRQSGYTARIVREGEMYVVCVGEYADRNEAKGDMAKLRGRYSDGFLRKF